MATKEHSTRRAAPPWLRFAPTISVSKLQKTSSCLSLTLLMFAPARAVEKPFFQKTLFIKLHIKDFANAKNTYTLYIALPLTFWDAL